MIAFAVILCAALALGIAQIVIPARKYAEAMALFETGQFEKARSVFEKLGTYRDSAERIAQIPFERDYAAAAALMDDRKYEDAILAFKILGDYKDSAQRVEEAREAIRARD